MTNSSPSAAKPPSVSKVVVDASAVLALLNREPGSEKLTPELLSDSVLSTVNLAEIQSKLVVRGMPTSAAWSAARGVIGETAEFTSEQARIAGDLIVETRALGLSLADRACLALGIVLKAPVYTADRSWKGLKLGLRIHVIR